MFVHGQINCDTFETYLLCELNRCYHRYQRIYLYISPTNAWSGYLEPKNDSPDEAEGESRVAVHDVVSSHVLEVNSLLIEKCQRLVNVLKAVNPHLSLRRIRLHIAFADNVRIQLKMRYRCEKILFKCCQSQWGWWCCFKVVNFGL